MFTPFNNERKGSDIDMTPSGYFPLGNSRSYMANNNSKFRFKSLLAIGNPIVDISAEVTREILDKYHLKFGETVFADKNNIGFYQELENMPQVSYLPGGSIQNTLRICAHCLNLDPSIKNNFFRLSMLGATGDDTYRDKIINSFNQLGVNYLLEKIPNVHTSRCGVGIHMKERCLLPEIRASNLISENFINENMDEICKHDALLIEGYFLQEKNELCQMLCTKFKDQRKLVILTSSAVSIVQQHPDKIIDISNYADMIVGNVAEMEAFAGVSNVDHRTLFEKASKKLIAKERAFVMTKGDQGVVVGKYDYNKGSMDFIFQCFPTVMKMEEIEDLNGAGDAFLGGFLSQYMQGKSLEACCKAGNNAASMILRSIGCTIPKNAKLQFIE